MGRKRTLNTAADLQNCVDDFIEQCQKTGDRPTDYAFARFLGIRPAEVVKFYTDDSKHKGFSDAMQDLIVYREDRLCELMEKDPKKATAAIIQLKQPHSGGYADVQPKDNRPKEFVVTIKGAGPDPFK